MKYLDAVSEIDQLITKAFTKVLLTRLVKLLGHDLDLKDYLFRTLRRTDWLIPLIESGIIKVSDISLHTKQDEDSGTTYWTPIEYLVRVSESVSLEDKEVIMALIELSIDASNQNVGNSNIQYHFARIVTNLPCSFITTEVIDCIPNWLNARFDRMLISTQVCEYLIPKLVSEFPDENAIKLVERAIKHVLAIEIGTSEYDIIADKDGAEIYKAVIDPYSLDKMLLKDRVIDHLAEYTSDEVLISLLDSMKLLLRKYVAGYVLRGSDNGEVGFHLTIEQTNLIVKLSQESKKGAATQLIINDFEAQSRDQLGEQLSSFWFVHFPSSDEKSLKEEIDKLTYILFDDSSPVWASSIDKMNTRSDSHSAKHVFAQFIKLIFEAKLSLGGEKAERAISLLTRTTYRLPLFRRILIHGIGKRWKEYKNVFWQLVKNVDEAGYFSQHYYREELYELLKSNAAQLTKGETKSIQAIIDKGYTDDYTLIDHGDEYNDYWQLRWYSALREIHPFRVKYDSLSRKTELSAESFEKDRTRTFFGPTSPKSKDEILAMDKDELAKYMTEFKQNDDWRNPSASGLLEGFKQALSEEPSCFTEKLSAFVHLPYDYAYSIVYGFENAWRQGKEFDWKSVLDFCHLYVDREGFGSDSLKSEQRVSGADASWVVGAIGSLITEGCRSSQHAFEPELIQSAKELLLKLSKEIAPSDEELKSSTDQVTYSYNSTSGKVLRGVVDCSVYKSRIENLPSGDCWDSELKLVFDDALDRKIEDAYVMTGHYTRELLYLDRKWLFSRISQFYSLENRLRGSFMSGILFERALGEPEFFKLIVPHYVWVIDNLQSDASFGSALTRHLVSFYFWEIEKTEQSDLLEQFLTKASVDQIGDLVHHLWINDSYLQYVKESDLVHFRQRILQLANRIYRMINSKADESSTVMLQFIFLTRFFEELSTEVFHFVSQVVVATKGGRDSSELIEWLHKVKNKGEVKLVAQRIAYLLLKVEPSQWLNDEDKKQLSDLIRFIYEQREKSLADDVCNRYAKLRNHDFVRAIYEENR